MISIQKHVRVQSLKAAWRRNQNKRNRIPVSMLTGRGIPCTFTERPCVYVPESNEKPSIQ